MRNSKQRDLILKIIKNNYEHPTAEEICNLCRKEMPNISLGTVYRNLSVLVENGSIIKMRVEDNLYRYDKWDIKHSHYICNSCKKIIDIPNNMLDNVSEIDGNKVLSYQIIFNGICKDCFKEEK